MPQTSAWERFWLNLGEFGSKTVTFGPDCVTDKVRVADFLRTSDAHTHFTQPRRNLDPNFDKRTFETRFSSKIGLVLNISTKISTKLFFDTKSAVAQSEMEIRLSHFQKTLVRLPLSFPEMLVEIKESQFWPHFTRKPLLLAKLRNGQSACNGFFARVRCTYPFYQTQANIRPQFRQTNF